MRIEDNNTKNIDTFAQTLHRELQEEIGESINVENCQKFLIYFDDNERSKKHLAICHVVKMDLENKKFKLVSDEFIQKTGTSKSGNVLKISDVMKEKTKLENWSRIILQEVFKQKIPPLQNTKSGELF